VKSIYLIGSLRNPVVPEIGRTLRAAGYDAFDDWYAAGNRADDHWQEYENARGHTYKQAMRGWAAQHVFEFDKFHLDRCDIGVLIMPAGKSGHLELGYLAGQGKPTFVLFDKEPERFDQMYQFAWDAFFSVDDLLRALPKVNLENLRAAQAAERKDV
jgi:hypothetical protein